MRSVPISQITLNSQGILEVTPDLPANEDFEFIWRAARSARWLSEYRSLTVATDSRLSAVEALECILISASGEYGVNLVLIPSTNWSNISTTLQRELSGVVARVA